MVNIHPQLQKGCTHIGRFKLCNLLLVRDANYPWFILVPDRENISEIHQLKKSDQLQLMRESSELAVVLENAFTTDKINIAALGNLVPQLHLHHVVRRHNDAVWPAPVWGKVPAKPYTRDAMEAVIESLRGRLTDGFEFVL